MATAMQHEQIKEILRRRPYWGAQSIAKALGTTPQTVRVVASRENIHLMDRYEVEAYADKLMEVLENLQRKLGGKT